MVVVCGEALVDRIHRGGNTVREVAGGGPFNTARALARLGVPTSFLGHLSEDADGRSIRATLTADGVDLSLATVGGKATTVAFAEVESDGGARYRFAVEGTAAPMLTAAMLPAQLGAGAALHVGSLGVAMEPIGSTVVQLVERERGRRAIALDPNVRPAFRDDEGYRRRLGSLARMATIVKASDADLAFMYPGVDHRGAVESLLAAGVALVVVTLGERGAFAAHGRISIHVPAIAVDVVDTIGAGDVFGAALLARLHERGRLGGELSLTPDELRDAVRHACVAAALVCMRAGADPPTRADVIAERRSAHI